MTQVINLILDRMVEVLTLEMKTNIAEDNLTRANEVKKGLLQQKKLENIVQIGLVGGDHEDPNYQDAIVSENDLQNIGIGFPAREVGGGQLWWRRGVVNAELFYISKGMTEPAAFDNGYEFLGRLMSLIENMDVDNIVDDYEERAIRMFLFKNTFSLSGGPPSSWIWRGKFFWACLTERP